jgi:hypothetical protein
MGIPAEKHLLLPPLLALVLLAPRLVLADPEECNGIDDDDDGFTDEDLPDDVPCSYSQTTDPDEGECELGVFLCLGGNWECDAPMPAEEFCDLLDNDCDGETDGYLALCPEGLCFFGQCAEPCAYSDLCPAGYTCTEVFDDFYCIPDVCNPLNDEPLPCVGNPFCCDDGFTPPCHCDVVAQQCVDDCYGVTVPDGFVCVPEDGGLGHPVGESCYVDGCWSGQICVWGECVWDPCEGAWCAEGEYCNLDGDCVEPCQVDCPDGCFENECVDDPCAGVLCLPGLSCEDGECVMGACWGVMCEFYEVCVDGECVHDPCWNIECPDCAVCIDGGCYEYDGFQDQAPDTNHDDAPDTYPEPDTDSDSGSDGADVPAPIEMRCHCQVVGVGETSIISLLLDAL